MNILEAKHIHLTGFKGVAMASIAQCLHDIGATLSGSDVAEDFVTKDVLLPLGIQTQAGFDSTHIPQNTNLLIYTAAHQGPNNPEVIWAKEHNIPTLSQAEALAELFNAKKGIAVCGVGGKSTTSAMISWIFNSLNIPISFSVGVGKILGMEKTGQWQRDSEYFVAEADEYVIDPHAPQKGAPITPRFSFLHPQIIVCTQLAFDHPDVYKDFEHTKQVFLEFFLRLKEHGTLIINGSQPELVELAREVEKQRNDILIVHFGRPIDKLSFTEVRYDNGHLFTQLKVDSQEKTLELIVPGKHNVSNACAALLATEAAHISIDDALNALKSFQSTQRRFEFKGEKQGKLFYDDYAHHPREIAVIVETLLAMFPSKEIFVAFQPHTFSRTKALFTEFAQALAKAPHTIITDIFASAREAYDATISSKMLAEETQKFASHDSVTYLPTLEDLTQFCQTKVPQGSVIITLGAGDIYSVHAKIRQ